MNADTEDMIERIRANDAPTRPESAETSPSGARRMTIPFDEAKPTLEDLFSVFGGNQRLALESIGYGPSTLSRWKSARHVPLTAYLAMKLVIREETPAPTIPSPVAAIAPGRSIFADFVSRWFPA